MNRVKFIPAIAILVIILFCNNTSKDNFYATASEDGSVPAVTDASADLPLSKIKLPDGFSISVFAEVDNAREMTMSPSGTIYVGSLQKGNIYAIKDTNGDHIADKKWVIASGLKSPNGVAFKDGDLYVAEISRISRYAGIETRLANPGKSQVVYDKLPTEEHHGWKYIAFGPDGKLYVPIGAPCNICEPDAAYASINRMNADGTGFEKFASGVRNTVGLAWHPQTKELWFTDNGRDMLGDDVPPCELNSASKAGMHFGYPYCHGGTIQDPDFGSKHSCSEFTAPAQNLGAHVAPLGLEFYTGNSFPAEYKNQIFIPEHGSWNRKKKSGYRISLVKVENGKSGGYETFASGWLDDATQNAWGRPVDVLVMQDGSILVSDDLAGVVYRIAYKN